MRLLLKFFDNQPPMNFYDDDILVVGELVAGNQAYADYLNCLDHFRRTITHYARQHAWLPPGTPVEKVVEVERDLLQLTQIFSGQISLRSSELPA